jgi:regulator of sigma E protease
MPTWIVFLGVLSILVLVHELGHFLMAIILGIKVEEFAFGLPFTKPIFKIKVHGTQYAVYPLLFGGFVRLLGEEGPTKVGGRKDDYWSRKAWQRMLVIVAGVMMNMVLALAVFTVLYSTVGVPGDPKVKVTIADVADNTPAKEAGLLVNDRIVEVEGKQIVSVEQFGQLMKSWAGLKVNLAVERGPTTPLFEGLTEGKKDRLEMTVVPRKDPPKGQGALGITIQDYPYVTTTKCSMLNAQCLIKISGQGFKSAGIWIGRVLDGLRQIGKSLIAGKAPEGVSGPVGIYQLTGLVAAEGWLPLLELIAVLSVNLAVFNVLPIPALDGGRLLFIWIELLMQKRVSAEVEQKINSWGMMFLLTLMVLISLQDVWRLGWIANLLGK